MSSHNFVVLGAGVIGLSTALTLRDSFPDSSITLLAEHFPGDYHINYTSPWAGGNWCSAATDNGLLESYDRITFERFSRLAQSVPEAGIARSPLRMMFDLPKDEAQILSEGTGKIWYEHLVGGLSDVDREELPQGAVFGVDVKATFVINTQVYLQWLLAQCRSKSIHLLRQRINHINDAKLTPTTTAIFNCTGLGSYSLPGILDKSLYPTRGQTILIQQPIQPLTRMYFRSPRRVDNKTTYIFQRPLGGGIVLGGCRQNGNWDPEPDMEFAKEIMKRCCELAPELGTPEDLKVISHGVGLRPSREGGPRIEAEVGKEGLEETVLVHNYGAGGTGFQASWGMAERGVTLLKDALAGKTESKL